MSGRYKHPANNGGYSDKVKGLIDGMLVVDPERRPDIDQVSRCD
jgi:serine/threonine kinase 16